MANFKSPLEQSTAILYPKPETNREFYSNAYKDGYKLKGNEARLGKGRINYLIDQYGVWGDNRDYAKAYLGFIDPREFIKGTVYPGGVIDEELQKQPLLDLDRVNNESQTPFLDIDFDGQVIKEHEGRHRLQSFANSGITRIPIVIRDVSPSYNKNNSQKKVYNGGIAGQRFDETSKARPMSLNTDLIPLNYKNIADLYRIFGDED